MRCDEMRWHIADMLLYIVYCISADWTKQVLRDMWLALRNNGDDVYMEELGEWSIINYYIIYII